VHRGRVLVVDDLPDVRVTLSGLLSDDGYDVRLASSRAEALHMVDAERFHVAVLDVRLDEADEENRDGLVLMHEIREKDPSVAIIILTGYADVKMVREALQPDHDGVAPAFGFLEKSEVSQLPGYVKRAVECAAPDVVELIAQGENDRVEFKSSIRWDYRQNRVNKRLQEEIARAIAGMLNCGGGHLLLGVADDGTILGIERDLQTLRKSDIDGFQLLLTDIVQVNLGAEYVLYIHPRFELMDGKRICAVSIDESPRPVFLGKGDSHEFWVRMGNSTRNLDVRAAMCYIRERWDAVE